MQKTAQFENAEKPPTKHIVAPMNWFAAVKAGLLAGVILLLFPFGIPWGGLSIGSMAIMGRTVPEIGAVGAGAIHLGLAVAYSIIIAFFARMARAGWGLLVGVAVGAVLYGVSRLVVAEFASQLLGAETRAVFAHLTFSLYAAGIYKGITRQRPERHPTS
jgi:hypothetical protein